MIKPKNDDLTEFQMMCFKKALEKRTTIENLQEIECSENICSFVKGEIFAYHQMIKWIEEYRLNEEKKIVDAQKKQKTESNSGVVYCKDCKFGILNGNQRVCTRLIDLDADTRIVEKNGYCSHGERREE